MPISQKTPAPSDSLRLFIFGSSTPAGQQASDYAHSFAGLLTTSLAALPNPWTITNYAVGATTSADMLVSVKQNAIPQKPTAVLLMPSLGNETNITTVADTALTTYKANLQQAIQLCRAAGIFVFLGTSPPRTDITTVTATYGATTLQQLQNNLSAEEESWQNCEVLVEATQNLGDGAGSYLAAYTSDTIHPNDTGHAALAASIPISRFNNLWAWNWSAIKGLNKYGTKIPNSAANGDIPWKVVLANSTSNNFALSFWVKRDTVPLLASFVGFSTTQALRFFQNPTQLSWVANDGSQFPLDTMVDRLGDLGWHHIVLSFRKQDSKGFMFLDGSQIGAGTVQAGALTTALDQVYLGTREAGTSPARNCWYRDVNFYLRVLWQSDATRLYRGDPPWGGLDASLPLTATGTIGCRTPNFAATDTFAVAGLTMDTAPAPILPVSGTGTKRSLAISESLNRLTMPAGDINPLSTGRLTLVPIALPETTVVTNIAFVSGATPAGTPTHWWFAIYDDKLNLIAQTTDQTSTAWAANIEKIVALSAAQTLPAGTYYLGVMVTATTVPTLRGATGIDTTLNALTPVGSGTSTSSLTNTAPNPAAAITTTTTLPYCYVS